MSCRAFCVHSDPEVVRRLKDGFRELGADALSFEVFEDAESLLEAAVEGMAAGDDVAMVFGGLNFAGIGGDDLFRRMKREPGLRGTRKILLDTAADSEAVDGLLQRGVMQSRLDLDFDNERLRKLLRAQLTDYVVNVAPHLMDDLHPLLNLRILAGALGTARKNLALLNERLSEVQRSVLGDENLSSHKVEEEMIAEFDRILNHPERHTYAAGADIVGQGDKAGRIWVILKGRVKLFRKIEGEEVIFHSESAGRMVGLMSLSLQNPVFFSCRAVTEVTALVLTREQVKHAVGESLVLPHYLITVVMRSMARRNQRSVELLTEVRALNGELGRQRDELAEALKELREMQDRLVDSAKMATLGNLAAGMAHELNNPVGAMSRSAEHLGDDVEALFGMAPELKAATETIPLARSSAPLSTRDERGLRRDLARDLEIEASEATRLVTAGIHSKKEFKKLSKHHKKKGTARLVEEIAYAGQIGTALRNVSNCSRRIAELVRSLKVYAREDVDCTPGVIVNQTLDDVLLILSNKVKDIELHKEYGDLPEICANPSQLQQVWTNLISNAAQALEGKGHIVLRTSVPRQGWVCVEVEDNGPGIPEEARERLWESRFTTRAGRVEFGLGFGLPIVRTLVRQHGGDIDFDSKPGRTVFTVELPECPNEAKKNA